MIVCVKILNYDLLLQLLKVYARPVFWPTTVTGFAFMTHQGVVHPFECVAPNYIYLRFFLAIIVTELPSKCCLQCCRNLLGCWSVETGNGTKRYFVRTSNVETTSTCWDGLPHGYQMDYRPFLMDYQIDYRFSNRCFSTASQTQRVFWTLRNYGRFLTLNSGLEKAPRARSHQRLMEITAERGVRKVGLHLGRSLMHHFTFLYRVRCSATRWPLTHELESISTQTYETDLTSSLAWPWRFSSC